MKTRILLIGGFKQAKYLAESLIDRGYRVTAINRDKEKCLALAEVDKLTVINGDGSNPYVLEEANAHNADIAIALTDRDDDNLVICELCKKRFHVKKTAALASDPQKAAFFYRMGIDSAVCAVVSIIDMIAWQTLWGEMAELTSNGDGNVRLLRVPIAGTAPAASKKLWELRLPKQAIISVILRGEKTIIPRGDTQILAGDTLALIASERDESAALRELTGDPEYLG